MTDPKKIIRAPKVTDEQLLHALEVLCRQFNAVSRGFDYNAITAPIDGDKYDGTTQWAIRHTSQGYMIVCGHGGCGAVMARWNGYIRTRWDFLMAMEMVRWSHSDAYIEKKTKKK